MFATLFQSFVGGHMESDYSPYDPIFYSVMAYIDKLWDDWQKKYEDGLLRYPPERRFLPMVARIRMGSISVMETPGMEKHVTSAHVSPTVLEGECCPVCLDCGQYADGEQWTPSPCQRCSCLLCQN
nr:hypothetical protein BaRGS_022929 [Batillaria attramentaria]